MSVSISELLPSISALSHADKFRLVQLVLAQLAQEEGLDDVEIQNHLSTFNPRRFFGISNQSKAVIDEYLAEV